MNTDNHGEENSPFRRRRLPSLNALRCFRGRRPPGELFPCRRGPVPDPRCHQPRRADPGGGTRLCALRTPRPAGFPQRGRQAPARRHRPGPRPDRAHRRDPARGGRPHRAGAVLRTDLADALADPADRRIHAGTATTVDPTGRRRRAVRLRPRHRPGDPPQRLPWPPGSHAHWLFDEQVGPVCRASDVERHFHLDAGPPGLRAVAPRLHTATRPQAWNTWTRLAGQAPATTEGQRFEHFYLSLQAAGAGLGVAIGPWQLVRDDLAAGLLAAPLGFSPTAAAITC